VTLNFVNKSQERNDIDSVVVQCCLKVVTDVSEEHRQQHTRSFCTTEKTTIDVVSTVRTSDLNTVMMLDYRQVQTEDFPTSQPYTNVSLQENPSMVMYDLKAFK
jgi:hypothetical protein